MLLPSAFPCDPSATAVRPHRPSLVSLCSYRSDLKSERDAGPVLASCRALQSLIGASLPSARNTTHSQSKTLRNPFQVEYGRITKPIARRSPPRGANKRRRTEFEKDLEQDAELQTSNVKTNTTPEINDKCSTPKRQRRVPMYMPLGLTAEDFHSLETPRPQRQEHSHISIPSLCSPDTETQNSDHDSGYGPSPGSEENEQAWTIDDDRMLVETVLEKLRLSKRDWNNCARMLGKDKDSIGRRWQMLVDEGNVGFKRGGMTRRTALEIETW